MKKILIFYGSYGGGHLSAAKSMSEYLKETYGQKIEVQIVDCIEYINKYINKVSTEAYKELAKKAPWAWKHVYKNSQNGALSHISTTTNKLMSHKLNLLIQDFRPDLIISTHPFSTQMCAVLKKRKKINCKLATILTDFHIHAQWLVLSQYVDYFFVSNEQMKLDMIKENVDENKIFVTGIPVSKRFVKEYNKEEIYNEFGLSPDKLTLLFFAGGEFGLGRDTTYRVLKTLIRLFKDLQVIAISGKNKKMNARFHELVETTNSSNRIKVLEYTNKVPELMSICLGVITKPGGLTVTECLVSGLPMVIMNPIPGQEEENAEFLVDNGVAVWLKKNDNIARTLKNLSKNEKMLENMSENAKKLSKPYATADITRILITELEKDDNFSNALSVTSIITYNSKYLFIKNNNVLHLLEGDINLNETPTQALHRIAQNTLNTSLDNINKISFESIFDENGDQIIYLNHAATINSLEKKSNMALISKDSIKNYKYSKFTEVILKSQNLL